MLTKSWAYQEKTTCLVIIPIICPLVQTTKKPLPTNHVVDRGYQPESPAIVAGKRTGEPHRLLICFELYQREPGSAKLTNGAVNEIYQAIHPTGSTRNRGQTRPEHR